MRRYGGIVRSPWDLTNTAGSAGFLKSGPEHSTPTLPRLSPRDPPEVIIPGRSAPGRFFKKLGMGLGSGPS